MEGIMDQATIEPAIKALLSEIHCKLREAARIAKAAEACALAGSIAEGVRRSVADDPPHLPVLRGGPISPKRLQREIG
jgi:hypothetical protein